jgi:hypothetical protein
VTARPAVDDGPTLWVGTSFNVTPRELPRTLPGIRAADAVRLLVQLRGGSADAYDIGPADGAYYAFRTDFRTDSRDDRKFKVPLLCALTPRGLADEIMADLSGVAAPGAR